MDSHLLADPSTRTTEPGPADATLRLRIERAIGASGYPVLWAVRVAVRNGTVTLHGLVSTFYLKQMAQTAALRVPGLRRLHNEITVQT